MTDDRAHQTKPTVRKLVVGVIGLMRATGVPEEAIESLMEATKDWAEHAARTCWAAESNVGSFNRDVQNITFRERMRKCAR